MKLNNIDGFNTIEQYVNSKLDKYSNSPQTFETLFEMMFSERNNVMAELSDGYKIKKITYGQFRENILKKLSWVKNALSGPKDSIVGIYMQNSVEWIEVFWCVLLSGYRPLLLNTRLDDSIIETMLTDNGVIAVISDGKVFCVNTVLARDIKAESTVAVPESFGSEVIFMSSGTTENVKLCAYNGESFYHQITASADIIKRCPAVRNHFEGELKQLALLPFYHVFGFIAVYLWFGFFSRTFVFLKDMDPSTVLNTIKKHKVTHLFAVPMVWEKVYKAAISQIKAKGDKTYKKFCFAAKLCKKLKFLSGPLFKEVHENLFGESICFMISGGSSISGETLEFFNTIGYPLCNGYGMTEIGITSVEVRKDKRTGPSIGLPFCNTRYAVSDTGTLIVYAKAMASRIITGSNEVITDPSKGFDTRDNVKFIDNAWVLSGRADDMIVCENGENLNPLLAENSLDLPFAENICIFEDNSVPVLIVSVPRLYSEAAVKETVASTEAAVKAAGLSGMIKKIYYTTTPLISGTDFKLNRRKVKQRFHSGALELIDTADIKGYTTQNLSILEKDVLKCFSDALDGAAVTGTDQDFFIDLNGTSLEYFQLLENLKNKFNISSSVLNGSGATTVSDFCRFISGMKN